MKKVDWMVLKLDELKVNSRVAPSAVQWVALKVSGTVVQRGVQKVELKAVLMVN